MIIKPLSKPELKMIKALNASFVHFMAKHGFKGGTNNVAAVRYFLKTLPTDRVQARLKVKPKKPRDTSLDVGRDVDMKEYKQGQMKGKMVSAAGYTGGYTKEELDLMQASTKSSSLSPTELKNLQAKFARADAEEARKAQIRARMSAK